MGNHETDHRGEQSFLDNTLSHTALNILERKKAEKREIRGKTDQRRRGSLLPAQIARRRPRRCLLTGQRDGRHTWRSFRPSAALFARAEAAAGIFALSRLANGQNSSPILVVRPAFRVVDASALPTKQTKKTRCAQIQPAGASRPSESKLISSAGPRMVRFPRDSTSGSRFSDTRKLPRFKVS